MLLALHIVAIGSVVGVTGYIAYNLGKKDGLNYAEKDQEKQHYSHQRRPVYSCAGQVSLKRIYKWVSKYMNDAYQRIAYGWVDQCKDKPYD